MPRFLVLSIIAIMLTACSPTPAAMPTELPSTTPPATITPNPTDTAIPTPTLEPWMQSLPESVISVEMDGDHVFGLDAEKNRIMQFDIESGGWMKSEKMYTSGVDPELMAEVVEDFTLEFGMTPIESVDHLKQEGVIFWSGNPSEGV